ncbi:hypothetical protein N7447_007521 [Penicillium robsamsonii]|uniref:uncharacterized protein n=1 Tax=Penicillium robsamsonii TaxID=1792511 RepID=UPI0025465CCA|nr:uncharacterized protein N7447_007521 [Penicillium robsamsonii]KAJ5817513.1 hypothetical protein N7447_007521 [Penicillium robsamsonii]
MQIRKRKSDNGLKAQKEEEPSLDTKEPNRERLDDAIRDMENMLSRQREKLRGQEELLQRLRAYRQ